MIKPAVSVRPIVETFQAQPTVHELLVALGVLAGAVIGAFIAGPGFGMMVITLAVVGAALWLSLGAAPSALPVPTSPDSDPNGSHSSSMG